jgi:hypothetical protein
VTLARASIVAALLAACGGSDSGDVVGPFDGAAHAFQVDHLALPASDVDTTAFGDDLDGNGTLDNRLGVIFSALVQTHDATAHGDDMIASGALVSLVTIAADSLADGTAGVAYQSGTSGMPMIGGRFTAGTFASNRSTSQHPGTAVIALPIFADADPLVMTLEDAELDLVPDGAGYTGTLRGGVPIDEARMAAYTGVLQMMVDNPTSHLVFARAIDTDHDGTVTLQEVSESSLLAGFLNPDLHAELISVGFAIHLVPCTGEPCVPAIPADACHDRVRDGNETDVDCGGDRCAPCAAGMGCGDPTDCQSNACDEGGCRGATCVDGVRDGFESDVDCGAACPKCGGGQTCANGSDCVSGTCTGGIASTGICAS